jgi:hypothetical protein
MGGTTKLAKESHKHDTRAMGMQLGKRLYTTECDDPALVKKARASVGWGAAVARQPSAEELDADGEDLPYRRVGELGESADH